MDLSTIEKEIQTVIEADKASWIRIYQLMSEVESEKLLASGEISHLLSGENDQSQSDRNNQCISFSFL